jgi:phosphoribosylformylglycinamidine cyclo-ligase
MPGFYADGEYDVAGFIVGIVDRDRLIDGSTVRPGDVLVGLPSAGLHTNGFSLARKILFEVAGLGPDDRLEELGDTVGGTLLREHRCYLRPLQPALQAGLIRGMAHITGGGLKDNLPRSLPPGTGALVRRGSWPVPPLFGFLQRTGNVGDAEMDRTFNLGIGMVVVVRPTDLGPFEEQLRAAGETSYRIGEVVVGDSTVTYG